MKWLVRLLAITLVTTCSGDNLVYVRVHRPLIEAQLRLGPSSDADRLHVLRSILEKAGCPQILEQTVPKEDFPNLICLLPGKEEGTIVIGASSRYSDAGAGAASGWGTLAQLPLLVESLELVPHRFTFALVAFAGHAQPARGAAWYVEHLTDEQQKNIHAMLDLADLGRTPPVFATTTSDRALLTWLEVAAHSLQLSAPARIDSTTSIRPMVNGAPVGRDEDLWANARPFVNVHIPSMTFRSAPNDSLPLLRRAAAIPDAVTGKEFDLDSYENTYRLLCVYLLYLDRNLGRPLIEPGDYTARIIDTAGLFPNSPVDLSLRIDNFSNSSQLNRYEQALQKGGQDALANLLADEPELGTLRFGLNLAFGAKMIAVRELPNLNQIMLVAVKLPRKGATPRDYRFSVVKVDLNGKGEGGGQYYSSAKLRFNKKHELEVEDFDTKPDQILQARLERPANAAPGTSVAEATLAPRPNAASPAPASTGAATAAATVASAPPGTNPPPTPKDVAVFKAKARLVLLDVTVTDADGRPVTGLQQSNFTVKEDGRPQEIAAFEAHVPLTQPAVTTPPPALPPHTFTNRVVIPAEDTLNIFLLDLLNTPVLDQAYARKQTIQFLKQIPPGRRIALFMLAQKLVVVQEFTSDSTTLTAAAAKIMNDRSILLTTEAERQNFIGSTEAVARVAAPTTNTVATGPVNTAGSPMDLGSAQSREATNNMMEAQRAAQRVGFTLDALTGLARSVSGYPGRKNLIWLSGSFPIRLKPNDADFNHTNTGPSQTGLTISQDFENAVRQATTALAGARIAVYPIDVRGTLTPGVDITVGAADSASFTGIDNPTAYKTNLNNQSEIRFQERASMLDVAQQTGGEVLAGNDIRRAIGRGIDDGSTYYTLAYTPAKDDNDPAFRRVSVNLNRSGLKLNYRPGYFPQRNQENPAQNAHPLIVAMQPGTVPSSAIPLTVVVLPPDGTSPKTRIDYRIDVNALDFAETADHRKRAILDCITVAFSKEGKPIGQVSNTLDVSLPPADYDAAVRDGFPVHQELDLPHGAYVLRLGVMDHASQKIGTLDAPLAVTAVAAAQ